MSGTIKSMSIKDLNKILKQNEWHLIAVIEGSKSYDKGCKVRNLETGEVTQTFSKNYECFEAMQYPEYHPLKSWPPRTGLFETPSPSPIKAVMDSKNTLFKYHQWLAILIEDCPRYGIDPEKETLMGCCKRLKAIYRKIK